MYRWRSPCPEDRGFLVWGKGDIQGGIPEPVVHSLEWTTSWVGNGVKVLELRRKPRASGPLWRVDHWLGRKRGKRAELRRKLRASGLLWRVDHWLGRKRGKRAELRRKPRASGLLWRVDHWLGGKLGERAETEVKAAS